MAKGKKHYSGKELIRRRQIERQQAEQQQGNRLTKTGKREWKRQYLKRCAR